MHQRTKCPKIYRKSVQHLLKYTAIIYISSCSTISGEFWDTQYLYQIVAQYTLRTCKVKHEIKCKFDTAVDVQEMR